MNHRGKRAASLVLALLSIFGSLALTVNTVDGAVRRRALKSSNLTGIQQQALLMFPRGSRLQDAATRLVDMGFLCQPLEHSLPDISSPSLMCGSNGRGYPDYPAINVTLVTRNGLISAIEVWNIIARADSDEDSDFTVPGINDVRFDKEQSAEAPSSRAGTVGGS